jgi:hypothetical protein
MKTLLNKIFINIIPSLVIFFAPISGLAIGIGMLIIFDTILGLAAAVANKVQITSRKLSDVISKSLLYLLSLYFIFPIDYYLLNDLVKSIFNIEYFVVKMVAVTISIIEIKSINENIYKIIKIDLWKKFKEILTRTAEMKDEVEELIKKD